MGEREGARTKTETYKEPSQKKTRTTTEPRRSVYACGRAEVGRYTSDQKVKAQEASGAGGGGGKREEGEGKKKKKEREKAAETAPVIRSTTNKQIKIKIKM